MVNSILANTPDPANTSVMVGYLWSDGFLGSNIRQKDNSVRAMTVTLSLFYEHAPSKYHTAVLALGWSKNDQQHHLTISCMRYLNVSFEMVAEDSLFRSIGMNRGSTTKQWGYHTKWSYHADLPPLPIPLLPLTTQPADPWKIALRNKLSEWKQIISKTTCSLIRFFWDWMQNRSIDLCLV